MSLSHDPLEDDAVVGPLIKAVLDEVADQVHREFDDQGLGVRGRCHAIWNRATEILRDRHGVDWKSPRRMNPSFRFD
jgi:hypothetical protein